MQTRVPLPAETLVVLLASRAPSQIPGQIRTPSSNSAAKAIPEAGQTAVAFPSGMANASPITAAAKQAAASRAAWAR